MQGERGEKGDQGQHGQAGDTGATGATVAINRWGVIGYAILSAFIVFSLWGNYQNNLNVCHGLNENRKIMRLILQDASKRTQTSKQRTPEEKAEAKEFYEAQLERLRPVPCDA